MFICGCPVRAETARQGEMEVVQLLLAAGASPAARDLGGRTPVEHALLSNRLEVAQLLTPGVAPLQKVRSDACVELTALTPSAAS